MTLVLIIIYNLNSGTRKNIFFALGEGPTFTINENFGSAHKKFSINFSKANTKLCLSLHHNADQSYLFVNGNESTIQMLTFQLNFFSEVYLMVLVLLNLEKYF